MSMITIRNLQFQYDAAPEINALYGIDLEIRKGECIVLTGESGCGKTTLTRCLNGLIPNFFEGTLTGEILYEGVPVNKLEQYELSRKIGTVFQDSRSQFFAVNTTDEVAFGCENLAFPTERINQNVDAAFSRMNIDVLRDRSLFGLSSGEKQRLAVASIYAMDTDVIVLDEPTANLDGETIQNLRELLFTLKAEGKTLIISEHRLSWLGGIADRYVYMRKGRIEKIWGAAEAACLSPDVLREYGLRSIQNVLFPTRKTPARSDANELTCQNLCIYYGKQEIIHDLNFHFTWGEEGRIIGIVGANGSGKTTFSKVLCGLMAPRTGKIHLNGKKMTHRELLKKTYFVMQDADYQLFTESVTHEMELAARKNKQKNVRSSKEETTNILDRFGLAEYSERHPLSLSGGQKQRVTIAASIAAKSDILVLDEPTSGLDGRNMLRLKNILRELKKQGMLIFIVTHDAEFLEGLTDELLTISNKEENMDKREKQQSPLRGILQFASQRKGLLRISVILSVLSSAFGMVPYAAVAVLLGKALDNALTIEWAVSLTLVALAGYFLKHFLYSKSTLCSHKAAYEIIQNIRCAIMRKMSKMSMGTIQEKSSGEFKQLVIDDSGSFVPTSVTAGEFTIFAKTGPAVIKKAGVVVEHTDFVGKYPLTPGRTLSALELSLIPKLPEWYIIPPEVVDICKHAQKTTGRPMQMRNFLLRGPAGTGKTMGAKAIAAGLGLPYMKYTCSANTEIFDFTGMIFPETDAVSTGSPELDREREILKSMGGISYANVAKLMRFPDLDDMDYDPAGVYQALTGVENLAATVQDCMSVVLEKVTEKVQALSKRAETCQSSGQNYTYVETDFVKALKHGYLVEVQEPSTIIQPGVLVGLNSLLEQEGSITLPTGEIIRRHPDTVVIVTTNVSYEGCRQMNQSVVDRMSLVKDIELPEPEVMVQRAMAVTGCADEYLVSQMVQVVNDMADYCRKNSITDGACGMRSLIDWVISAEISGDPYLSAKYTVISKATADEEDREALITTILDPMFAPKRKRTSA